MKTLIYKFLIAATLTIASSVLSIAQTRAIEHEFSEYDAISVSSDFKVSLSGTETITNGYGVKITVDDALESYVQCYVKAKTLYIGLDEKSIPKELKKQYKSKNAAEPVLTAVIYLPSLKSITLSDASVFTSSAALNVDKFNMDITDNSSISNLSVVSKNATLKVTKKAKLTSANVKADNISVTGDGNAEVTLEYSTKNLDVNNGGSAQLTLNGNADKVTVTTANNAKSYISGKASSLKAQGSGNSSLIDASALPVNDAAIAVNAAEVKVNSENTLSLDLGKGAKVTFAGDPVIKIVGIQNSTVAHN